MQLGYNVTSGKDIDISLSLLEQDKIQFVELLIDSFLYVDPQALKARYAGVPINFHIIDSNFLQNSQSNLQFIAERIRGLADVLMPEVVSDHLLQFKHGEVELPMFQEIDYANADYTHIFNKIRAWSDLLGCDIRIENVASADERGRWQADYFNAQLAQTPFGVLLDFSNLDITLKNTSAEYAHWQGIVQQCDYCHVGGYHRDPETDSFYLDSHDTDVSDDSLALIQAGIGRRLDQVRLVYERDFNYQSDDIHRDITHLRESLSRAVAEPV